MLGAPALCATAAFRGGVGLVKLAASAELLPWILSMEPSATGIALSSSDQAAVEVIAHTDAKAVWAIGPGLGQSPEAGVLVMQLLQSNRATVLDADGLNALAQSGQRLGVVGGVWGEGGPTQILTPHPGEFRRLAEALKLSIDWEDRPAAATALAQAHHAVVVLKGHQTVVADADRHYVNTTGNPALATAGSGDILTGLIASLIAQEMDGFEAAVLGVYLHGLAADLWAKQYGARGMKAIDLANLLPQAWAMHEAMVSSV